MSGAKMQLQNLSESDARLVGYDCSRFFQSKYYRHTPFAFDIVDETISAADFGKSARVTIGRNGEMITKMVLKVEISDVKYRTQRDDLRDKSALQFAWVTNLGYALIEECEIIVGGTSTYRHTGEWLHMWNELAGNQGKQQGVREMVGDVAELTVPSHLDQNSTDDVIKRGQTLYIPLQFPFCRNNGLALPVACLRDTHVEVKIKFRSIEQLTVRSPTFDLKDVHIINASLLVEYIHLSPHDKHRLLHTDHEYLVDDVHSVGTESATNKSTNVKLTLGQCSKALYWTIKNSNYQGERFMVYQPYDWNRALEEAAKKLLISQFDLDDNGLANQVTLGNDYGSYDVYGHQYDAVDPAAPEEEAGFVFDDGISRSVFDGQTLLGRLSLSEVLLGDECDDLRHKVDGIIRLRVVMESVPAIFLYVERITRNDLTIEDLSRVLGSFQQDNRNHYIKGLDLIVWQHDNYGVYIDGTGNPVKSAEIMFNGIPRQRHSDGTFYNRVMPDMTHNNIPKTGINMYSFSLAPEHHQPTGHCNFEKIDGSINLELKRPDGIVSKDDRIQVYSLSYRTHTFCKDSLEIR